MSNVDAFRNCHIRRRQISPLPLDVPRRPLLDDVKNALIASGIEEEFSIEELTILLEGGFDSPTALLVASNESLSGMRPARIAAILKLQIINDTIKVKGEDLAS